MVWNCLHFAALRWPDITALNEGVLAMQTPVTYRMLLPDDWETYRELRLAALRESPEAFGSTLVAEQPRVPEQWRDRLAAAQVSDGALALVALAGKCAVGLVWAKADTTDAEVINVFQMWVAPEHRNHGIGKALLGQIIDWAKSNNAKALQLGAVCGDTPAIRLYSSVGFLPTGSTEPLREGSSLISQSMRLDLRGAV